MAPPSPKTLRPGFNKRALVSYTSQEDRKRVSQRWKKDVEEARKRQKNAKGKRGMRGAAHEEARKNGRYTGTIEFRFKFKPKGRKQWVDSKSAVNIPLDTDIPDTNKKFDQLVGELIDERIHLMVVDSPFDDVQEIGDRKITVMDVGRSPENLASRRAQRTGVLTRAGTSNAFDTGKGQCVFDWIRTQLGDRKGLIKCAATNEVIALIMTGAFGEYSKNHKPSFTKANIDKALRVKGVRRDVNHLLENGVQSYINQHW
eukprot:jgi/Chrzof1/1121/Cz01g41010.t1